MNGLEIGQIIVIEVHTDNEEQPSIAPINNFESTELSGEMAFTYSYLSYKKT